MVYSCFYGSCMAKSAWPTVSGDCYSASLLHAAFFFSVFGRTALATTRWMRNHGGHTSWRDWATPLHTTHWRLRCYAHPHPLAAPLHTINTQGSQL